MLRLCGLWKDEECETKKNPNVAIFVCVRWPPPPLVGMSLRLLIPDSLAT